MPPEFSPQSETPPVAPPRTGRKVFLLFAAFFLVLLVVNGAFVLVAVLTNPGTVTDEAYEKGLAYNKVIDEAQSQQRLGWSHRLTIRMEPDGKQRIALRMSDARKQTLDRAGALIRFYRPVENGIDFDVHLKETRAGTYIALASFPEPGAWDAYIAVRKGNEIYRARERVIIR